MIDVRRFLLKRELVVGGCNSGICWTFLWMFCNNFTLYTYVYLACHYHIILLPVFGERYRNKVNIVAGDADTDMSHLVSIDDH